jgi:hypothetical protein
MRQACLYICFTLLCACSDDDADRPHRDAGPSKVSADAGTKRGASALRPALPRAPKGGLPEELRPPR